MNMRSLLLIASLGACVPLPGYANDPADETQLAPAAQVEPDELSLRKRVSSRWDALIAQDFAQAYGYFSPLYRKLFPLEHYLREVGTTVGWVSNDIQNIAIEGDRAEVKSSLYYRVNIPPQAGFGSTEDIGLLNETIQEVWLWKEGNWWYIKRDGGGLLSR